MAGARHRRQGSRPWIAMILAYVVAIQAMLAATVGVQHAVAASSSNDPAVICFGMGAMSATADDPALQRLHQPPCTICALAFGTALPPEIVAFLLPRPVANPVAHRSLDAILLPVAERTPRLSQGPPQKA